MELSALRPDVVDRLIVIEREAMHLAALAEAQDRIALQARQKADLAQLTLSAIKLWIASLPADAVLEARRSGFRCREIAS